MSRGRSWPEEIKLALLLGGGRPLDPRSYVADQTWLAELKETGLLGVANRNVA